ncbi:sigma 54-interacting transcriptional regulator [Thermodesulfobacteriota bacterium]
MHMQNDHHITNLLCDQWLIILDEMYIGAFTVDLRRRVTAINACAQSFLGLQDDDVLGRDCREIFLGVPCLSKCPVKGGTDPVLDEPQIDTVNTEDGKHLISRLATPVYGPDQRVIGCLTILQDHTPIAELISRIYHEERSLKIILDNLDVGIFTVTRGGYITFFNTAAEKITGYNREHVLGRHCSKILENDGAENLPFSASSAKEDNIRIDHSGKMITRDGESIPIRAKQIALRNEKGKVVGGLTTFHDLTLIHQLDQVIRDHYTFHDMIGKSPVMQKIFDTVNVVAETDATMLIEGATGTGKDLLAKVIHSASRRASKPLVKVNCAAIPDNLLESELFGYVKGAFTGADRDKPGRFQEADHGTIFLDEIGDLPLSLQAKLLRVLEDREFYPLGDRQTKKVDVRIVSATNRGLENLVRKRLFREDLFYRLNVFRIELPELKDRLIDLPLLIPHIMRRLCAAKARQPGGISEKAMKILLNYSYPGNIRELENILEHALIVGKDDIIEPDHLPEYLNHPCTPRKPDPSQSPKLTDTATEEEKETILSALQSHDWHRGEAARELGMDRTTLWRKIKKWDLSPDSP